MYHVLHVSQIYWYMYRVCFRSNFMIASLWICKLSICLNSKFTIEDIKKKIYADFQLLAEKACSDSKVENEELSREDSHWSVQEQSEDGPSSGRGLFDIKYHTLISIGKGAFGFVKLAKRKIDEEEVLSENYL